MRIQSGETGQHDLFVCGGELNFTDYCQRLVTRDLDQAERILDSRPRARVLNRADAQMADPGSARVLGSYAPSVT